MNGTLLHLTHTDIRRDSRIVKELFAIESVAAENGYKVVGLGIAADTGPINPQLPETVDIVSVHSYFRTFRRLFRPLRHILVFLEVLFRFLKLSRTYKPVVVHCHDTLVLPIAVFIKWRSGAQLVYDAHELESDRNGQRWIESFLTKKIEKICWRHVDLFISVSPSINEWYVKEFSDKKNILVLNSPEISSPQDHAETVTLGIRERFGIGAQEKVFVYLGILAKGRGLEAALDVFANPEVGSHLVCVGWGELEKNIREYALENKNIHLHEPVQHNDVVPLIRECNFGLCMIEAISLSGYLCLPNKLFEYCFAGLPVLASNFPELSRVVKEHEVGQEL